MKNKITQLLATIAIFSACTNEVAAPKLIISGQIDNPNSDSLVIRNSINETVHTIRLSEDNTFADTLEIEEGYYSLFDGKESTPVFLMPNFNINLTCDAKQFDETISYSGIGAGENNYEAENSLLEESFRMKEYYGNYVKLNEEEFLNLTDSLYTLRDSLFSKYKDKISEEFIYVESNELKYKRLGFLNSYGFMRRYFTKDKNFKVSEKFPKVYEDINLDDENLLKTKSYLYFVNDYLSFMTNEIYDRESGQDYIIEYLIITDSLIANKEIKGEITFYISKRILKNSKQIDKAFNKAISMISNKKYIEKLSDKYQQLKKIAKGEFATDFEIKDVNGNLVKLSDLRGKPVYIDIWATWCSPCIKEIPKLKELEEEFQGNIHFVSICKSDTEDRWKAMIEDKKLGGIQLFTDEQIPFFTDFMVQGIPRFILIDKEGKIVEANAPRPSWPQIKEVIKELI